jgi:hypothetical protein
MRVANQELDGILQKLSASQLTQQVSDQGYGSAIFKELQKGSGVSIQ